MFKIYTRKPLKVRACQYWPLMKIEGVENVKRDVISKVNGKEQKEVVCTYGKIIRSDGNGNMIEMIVNPGEWVIKEDDGSFNKVDYATWRKDFDDEPV